MPAVDRKTTAITNLDNNIRVKPGLEQGSRVIAKYGVLKLNNGELGASKWRLIRVRSTDVLIGLRIWIAADDGTGITSFASVALGLSHVIDATGTAGATVDSPLGYNLFFGPLNASVDPIVGLDCLLGPTAATYSLSRYGTALWEYLGLASDPHVPYDITLGCHVASPVGEDGYVALLALIAAP